MFVPPPADALNSITVTLTRAIDAPPAAVARACRDASLLHAAPIPAAETATVTFILAPPGRAAILLGHPDAPVHERRPLRVTHLAAPGHLPPALDPTDAPLLSTDHLTLALAFAPRQHRPAATARDRPSSTETTTTTLCTLLVQLVSAEPCRSAHMLALYALAEAWAHALAHACRHTGRP